MAAYRNISDKSLTADNTTLGLVLLKFRKEASHKTWRKLALPIYLSRGGGGDISSQQLISTEWLINACDLLYICCQRCLFMS